MLETCYWSVSNASPQQGNIVDEIGSLFDDAVRIRMISDVPVGIISGGLDSSAIAASMKDQIGESDDLNVLSVVSGSQLDESRFVDIMSDFLGSEAHKITLIGILNAVGLLKKVTWHNDTPLGSFSNAAHYLMMKRANELGVTVILSGQGERGAMDKNT